MRIGLIIRGRTSIEIKMLVWAVSTFATAQPCLVHLCYKVIFIWIQLIFRESGLRYSFSGPLDDILKVWQTDDADAFFGPNSRGYDLLGACQSLWGGGKFEVLDSLHCMAGLSMLHKSVSAVA